MTMTLTPDHSAASGLTRNQKADRTLSNVTAVTKSTERLYGKA
jgi:hypothetical protein